ncbi:NAD(P)H-binding protein [Lacticaseibacillus sharpeae]|nr:NAD(P)H-binding protein [Lacticaseibacillus sharpeae]
MTTYALTGVTGHFGQTAIQVLTKMVPTANIIALARNTEKAQSLVPAGVTVRPGDYDDPEQLKASLAGVDRLLFISSQPGGKISRLQQHKNVVDAAKSNNVSYIAYTSFPKADQSTTPLAADHAATEAYIKKSGISYSFLRDNWYLENEAGSLAQATSGKPFVYSAGDGKAGWALEKEYAEAAAKVLASESTKPIYEFGGQTRTYNELADAIDAQFDVVKVDDSAYAKGLEASGIDEGTAALVTSFQTLIRDGQLDVTSSDLEDVLGHELIPIADAIQEVVKG